MPVLFDGRGRVLRHPSRYLRERATLQWHPSRNELGSGGRDYPTPATLRHIAYAVAHFLSWGEARGLDWRTACYDDVLCYQREQLQGLWSARKGRKLQPGTANARADEATHFLAWASFRALREPFPYPRVTKRRAVTASGGSACVAVARAGRAREARPGDVRRVLLIPSAAETAAWLDQVRRRRGSAKALLASTILQTGVRLKEVVALTTDQIPSAETLAALRASGRAMAPVHLSVTKGGRPRTIDMPAPLAAEIRLWIDTRRLVAAHRHRHRTGHLAGERLFISDAPGHEGVPLQRHTVQRLFREMPLGTAAWSAHLGRHTYACNFLLHAMRKDAAAAARPLDAMGADWVRARGSFWLDILRRQLGHLGVETTGQYLRWLASAVGIADLASGWHEALNGGAGDAEPVQ
ncbi:site-specific integrase [Methylobacterium sp. Leaf123]|uniref:site-specific integrase n=1 Tax=Methylobacterium sp. Leaf123 TaxID=1736264 RepID=UPI00138F81F7|nr:site-specific integrase [Methylobacterium sp. Leaf123]